jgi:hypothetical protein
MKKKTLTGVDAALKIEKLKTLYSRDMEHIADFEFCSQTGVPVIRLLDPEVNSISISTLEKWMGQFKKLEKLSSAFKRK